jgi:hypothetical protein
MIKYRIFSVKFGEYAYKTVDIDRLLRSRYDNWYTGDIGQWAKENNIKLIQSEMLHDQNTRQHIYNYYMTLTDEQDKEYKEILFYKKLTE